MKQFSHVYKESHKNHSLRPIVIINFYSRIFKDPCGSKASVKCLQAVDVETRASIFFSFIKCS